jgi:hypothetical protein
VDRQIVWNNHQGVIVPTFPFCLLLALAAAETSASDDGTRLLKITMSRDDDRADVNVEKDKTIVLIHSPFGIGSADIQRTGEQWPDAEVSVSSQDGKVRLWTDGNEEAALDSNSPLWMAIRIVGREGKPAKTTPLEDGYFEMRLPKAIFEANPKSITVKWIDFHRN